MCTCNNIHVFSSHIERVLAQGDLLIGRQSPLAARSLRRLAKSRTLHGFSAGSGAVGRCANDAGPRPRYCSTWQQRCGKAHHLRMSNYWRYYVSLRQGSNCIRVSLQEGVCGCSHRVGRSNIGPGSAFAHVPSQYCEQPHFENPQPPYRHHSFKLTSTALDYCPKLSTSARMQTLAPVHAGYRRPSLNG